MHAWGERHDHLRSPDDVEHNFHGCVDDHDNAIDHHHDRGTDHDHHPGAVHDDDQAVDSHHHEAASDVDHHDGAREQQATDP